MLFNNDQLKQDITSVTSWSQWAININLRDRIQTFVRTFGPATLPNSPLYRAQRDMFLNYVLESSKIVVLNFDATSITLSVPGVHLGAIRQLATPLPLGLPSGGGLVLMPYGLDHVSPHGEQSTSLQNLFGPAYTKQQCVGDNHKVEIETMKNFAKFGLGSPAPGAFYYRGPSPHDDLWKQLGAGVAAPRSHWSIMCRGHPSRQVTIIFDKPYIPPQFVVVGR